MGGWTESVDGSSPHTRGARDLRALRVGGHRIIPAYAGSTCRLGSGRRRRPDHPRIRGEHLEFRGGVVVAGGSSPHTRGAPVSVARRAPGARIIPAYAGSTVFECGEVVAFGDHPRIRGEHL